MSTSLLVSIGVVAVATLSILSCCICRYMQESAAWKREAAVKESLLQSKQEAFQTFKDSSEKNLKEKEDSLQSLIKEKDLRIGEKDGTITELKQENENLKYKQTSPLALEFKKKADYDKKKFSEKIVHNFREFKSDPAKVASGAVKIFVGGLLGYSTLKR